MKHVPPRPLLIGPPPDSNAGVWMNADVVPSVADRRAVAAASPDRKMGKRKKLSARKDV